MGTLKDEGQRVYFATSRVSGNLPALIATAKKGSKLLFDRLDVWCSWGLTYTPSSRLKRYLFAATFVVDYGRKPAIAAFALAGNFNNGAPTNQGSNGNYWSSSRNNNTNMYNLNLNTSNVNPANNNNRNNGNSIRCVLK